MIFQNNHCYFLRKPPHLASTRGKEESFLDIVFKKNDIQDLQQMPGSRHTLEKVQQQYLESCIYERGLQAVAEEQHLLVIEQLLATYTPQQEYGLLNRLDTATSGLLYFAKTPEIYTQRKQWQIDKKIRKYYIAKVHNQADVLPGEGEMSPMETEGVSTDRPIKNSKLKKGFSITTPLAHHTNGKHMIVATDEFLASKRKQKIKGKLLPATTHILKTSTLTSSPLGRRGVGGEELLIMIHKGRRHQIRAHLASIGSPIIGEQLYDTSLTSPLQLFSIGCTVQD